MHKDRPTGLAVTAPDGLALAHYFSPDALGWAHALAATTAGGFTLAQLFFWEALPMHKGGPIGLAVNAPDGFDLARHFSGRRCQCSRMDLLISCHCRWPRSDPLIFWDVPPMP
jgi:hypothetical protein